MSRAIHSVLTSVGQDGALGAGTVPSWEWQMAVGGGWGEAGRVGSPKPQHRRFRLSVTGCR